MKDEIKEILDSLKDILDEPKGLDEMPNGNLYEYDRSYDLEQDEIKILLDYITNLQEENERLKRDKNMIFDANCNLSKVMNNYKTRIDKAIELLNDWNYLDKIDCYYEPKEVIDILKGSDK